LLESPRARRQEHQIASSRTDRHHRQAQPSDGEPDVRVMVVDDQEIFRSVLRDLVEATDGFRLVGDAASSEAALARMAALQPDFIVMDVCLGTGDGVETAGSILRRYPDRLVLLISVHELMGASPVGPSGETIPFVCKPDLSCDVLREAWHAHLTATAYGR
jgi:two-component system, NarL family, invasion response regulator UvrY